LSNSVIEVVYNFCSQNSLKSATDWCQTERQIQQDAWGSARIACVSTMPALLRTVCKCLKRNNGHLITPHLNWMEISCLTSDARSYFE